IPLRLVQGSSLLAMDVLEFGANHTADDGLHLLRDSDASAWKKIHCAAQLRRFSIWQRGIRDVVCRRRSRRKARLVALRTVHCPVPWRLVLFVVVTCAPFSRSQSPGGLAIPASMEHFAFGPCSHTFSFQSSLHNHSYPAVLGNPRIRG